MRAIFVALRLGLLALCVSFRECHPNLMPDSECGFDPVQMALFNLRHMLADETRHLEHVNGLGASKHRS